MVLAEPVVGVEHHASDLGDVVGVDGPGLARQDLLRLRDHPLEEEGDRGQHEDAEEDAQLQRGSRLVVLGPIH